MSLTKAGIKRMLTIGKITNKFINDLLDIDTDLFNKIPSSNLRKIIKVLSRKAHQRIAKFNGETSPALEKFARGGGVATEKAINKMDVNQLRNQFKRHKEFLQSKTSKKEEWDQTKQDIIDMMNVYGVKLDESNYEMIWKAYGLLRELDPVVAVKEFKYEVLKRIIELYDEGLNARTVANRVHNELEGIYQGVQEERWEDYADLYD